MTWYVAHVMLECRNLSTGQHTGSVEEQVRVLTAADAEEAYQKALQLGRSAEHEYDNNEGEKIRWAFCGLSDLDELMSEGVEDGSEITSRIIEDAEIRRHIRRKDDLTLFLAKTIGKMKAKEVLG